MGLPDIVIEFTKTAVASFSVGSNGIVGMILKDTTNNGVLTLTGVDDIPEDLTADNIAYIERAFTGEPTKVIAYVLPADATDYTEAQKYFATVKVNYIVGDPAITTELATNMATWVAGIRKNTSKRPVAVLPNTASDKKSVINFSVVNATEDDNINVDGTIYTEAQYCSRIAGLLAGLDLKVSSTFKPLSEVTSIPLADQSEVDEAVNAGKLTLYFDGDRVVIARGVNSLVTTTETETEDLQKIKILAIQDLIETDIYSTINQNYIGNYANSYDNKCLLVTAIKSYLQQLESKGYLAEGSSTMEINVAKQKLYLESKGTDTSSMSEQEIREANTGSYVFLKGSVSILDAIEDVDIVISKE